MGPAPSLTYANDSCWGRDVERVTKAPADVTRAVVKSVMSSAGPLKYGPRPVVNVF